MNLKGQALHGDKCRDWSEIRHMRLDPAHSLVGSYDRKER